MADPIKPTDKPADKKFDKPAPAAAPAKDPFIEIVSFFAVIFIALFLLNGLFRMINSSHLFSRGFSGLTPKGIILNHTRPIVSLNNPIGAHVVALHDLSVYNDPGGKKVGDQPFNARGKIVQGPVTIAGVTYYYVDFDTGTDGWVRESDIGYLESEPNGFERFIMFLFDFISFIRLVAVLFSIVLIGFITYVVRRLTAIRVNEQKLLYMESTAGLPKPEDTASSSATVSNIVLKWQKIKSYAQSENENDWRQSIIEADIMLANLLEVLGLPGDTMGDKLKAVEKSDFLTIDQAWEAHKVRNQIAHDGVDFKISQRETKRVISLYEEIFEEFKII